MKRSFITFSILILILGIGFAQKEAGRIVALRGRVEVQAPQWKTAVLNQNLFEGDVIRTLTRSRVVILLVDETQLKLNENTQIQLRSANHSSSLITRISQAGTRAETIMNLDSGRVYVRSKKRPARVRVETPAVTAAIRGTEFDINVSPDGETFATVLEGSIDFRNDFGAIVVNSGEQGQARIGEAPTKTVILNPEDAVQWTLFFSASVSSRDYPLTNLSPEAARAALEQSNLNQIQRARLLHDLGRQDRALAAVEGLASPEAEEIRGWIFLEQNQVGQAVEAFGKAPPDSNLTRLGLSLAHLRLNEFETAYGYVADSGDDQLLGLQKATLQLINGEAEAAAALLESVPGKSDQFSLAQGLLSTVYLARNRKDEAMVAARKAVEARPGSPSAHLSLSLVQQAFFDLAGATRSAEEALRLDPGFLQAQSQYARLLCGAGRNSEAEILVRKALETSPEEATLHSALGFLLLSQAKSDEALFYLKKAVELDSTLAETHLGMGIYHMRKKEPLEAAAEFLAAATLEPRISLYQSYLSKAFYETRDFEQAFLALDTAIDLDPLDPTPHLYAGIMQEDLNRPGVAVKDYQRSIQLNDNRAVYRSRYLLDEDRATRNVSLARAYNRLGLGEWGNSEAIKSNLSDTTNSSAHLFLADTFLNLRGRTGSAGSELLVARMLMPVNTNSFNSFNDYTTLFERPRLNWTVGGGYGSFDTANFDLIATGGASRYAYGAILSHDRTDGFTGQNYDSKDYTGNAVAKFALSPSSGLLLSYAHQQRKTGDLSNRVIGGENDPDLRNFVRTSRAELGYHNQLRPGSELLFHLSARSTELVTDEKYAFPTLFALFPCINGGYETPPCGYPSQRSLLESPSLNFQASHFLKLEKLQFKYGLDVFGARTKERINLHYLPEEFSPYLNPDPGTPRVELDPETDRKDIRATNLFLQSDYQAAPNLTLTGGLNFDWANDDNTAVGPGDYLGVDDELNLIEAADGTTSQWNPQGGLVYSPHESSTLRLAAMRSLQPLTVGLQERAFTRERLLPTHVNGYLLNRNEFELSRTDSFNLGWDQRICESGFARATVFWRNRSIPTAEDKEVQVSGLSVPLRIPNVFKGNSYGGALAWNQFVLNELTLVPDYSFVFDEDPGSWRRDHNVNLSLNYVHPVGIFVLVRENYLNQRAQLRSETEPFKVGVFTTDASVSYEMLGKIGLISFQVNNLFDKRYQFVVDPFALDPRIPRRQLLFSLSFNF